MSFQQKLWVPLICSLLCIFIIFVYGAVQTRDLRIEERSNDLSNVDEVGLSVLKHFGAQVQSGALSKEEAQKRAKEVIKSLRFGKDGYISITTSAVIALMNPFKPENDGKDMSNFKDATGVYLYRDIAAAGGSAAGAGFVHYHWNRPGGTEPVAKMSRVVRYAPWEWDLVTGVYMDDIDDAFRVSLYKSAGVLAVVFVLLWLVVSAINRSLRHTIGGDPAYASEVAQQIADGDLSTPVQTHKTDNSSILFGMRTMQAKLADTIGEIRRSADTIAIASAEIASGNMDLSARTESQASSLEETAASMEELTATVNQNAANAQQANQLVISAAQVAEKGGHVVSQVVRTMETINASATRIVDIISVIDGIAFQTNILALNAAVEAARAGEQGRGFAVVATEVRNLAHRSAAAAKEIKELIGDSVDSIKAGSALVAEAGTTMDQVVASVSRVTEIMGAISSASHEQSTGIGHVNQAITEMDSVTQQNAALVEQAAAAAGSMQDQAAMLAQLVTRFRLSAAEGRAGGGGNAATPRVRAAAASGRLALSR
nr:methyl-accepting chemotaxis protein [Rugamonas sp. CCM 8940]